MKITKKEIDILTNAITNEVYDNKKIDEQVKKECDDMWNKFKKTKQYKELEKILVNPNYYGLSIYPNLVYWFGDNYNTTIRGVNWLEVNYKNNYRSIAYKKYPNSWDIYVRVQTLLTIKALGWKDIETVMQEIKEVIKKEFKNL